MKLHLVFNSDRLKPYYGNVLTTQEASPEVVEEVEEWKVKEIRKRKKTSSSSSEEDSLNQRRNQDKISSIAMKLSENGNKDKELKNELWRMIGLMIQIIGQMERGKSVGKEPEKLVRTINK